MAIDSLILFEQETHKVLTEDVNDIYQFFNSFVDEVPEATAIGTFRDVINRVFAAESLEEVFTALKREDTYWSRETLRRLNECSPLMLHVTFRLQRIGRYLNSIEDAFELEFRIANHMIGSLHGKRHH